MAKKKKKRKLKKTADFHGGKGAIRWGLVYAYPSNPYGDDIGDQGGEVGGVGEESLFESYIKKARGEE